MAEKTSQPKAPPQRKAEVSASARGPAAVAPTGFDRLVIHGAVGNLGIQRAARDGGGEGESGRLETGSTPKSGAVLPSQFGAEMEARFGTSFRDVRLHTDAAAHHSTHALNAKAYTVGSDIFFSAGRFDPQSTEGRELLAHELAHVAQQQRGAARSGGGSQRVTQTTDPAETEAKQLARQPRPVAVSASADTIHRDADTKVPEDFLVDHYPTLASELRNGVQIHTFSLGTPHATWQNDGESRFKMQVAEHMFPSLGDGLGNLRNALSPTSDEQILGAVQRGTLDGNSSTAAPAVAFELMPMVKRQIDGSLRRIIPRYLSARNQTAQSSSTVSQPAVEPPLNQIPVSAKVDLAILAGLLSGTTDFHELDYRAAFPQEARPSGDLGLKSPGNIQFLAAQGMPLWIRVERTDSTVEDVAHTLYGTSTLSNKIVGATPLFGIDPGSLVEEPYRRQWREAVAKAGLAPMSGLASQGFYPVGSPMDQIPDSMRDEVILNQAKALAPTGATPLEVVQQMRVALGLADQMIAMATKFGVAQPLQGMRTRLDARSKKFATKDAASEAETWGPQAARQYATLSGATSGLQVACAELKNYGDGEIPPFIRQPLHALATAYIEAGALSEFPGAAVQKLTLAQALNQTYATDVLNGALLFIHDSLKAISSDQAEEMGGSTAGLAAQEQVLRLKLASIRNELLTNPKRASELIKELQTSVNKLSNRVGVLNALSTIDSLIDALKTHVSNVYSTPSGSVGTGMPLVDFRTGDTGDSWKTGATKPFNDSISSLREFRTLWAPIAKAAFTGTDEELAQQLKSVAPKQKELNAQLDAAMKLAQGTADFDSMFAVYRTFLIGFAIALVTFGVGEIVAGIAIGAELSGASVFLLSTGAEALTMTVLNAAVTGKEGWEHFGTDFIWNFATAGIMKGVSRIYKGVLGAAAKTGAGAAGEFTVSILAGTLASLAKADFDQRQRTGKGLTEEQARHVTRDSLIQGIALAIGMRVVHDYLPNFKAAGTRFGARIAKINKSRAEIRAKAASVQRKPTEEEAQNLSGEDSKLVEEEIRLTDEILATPGISEQDRTTLSEARTDAGKATEAAGARNMMMYLEEAGPNQFLCAEGHLNDVKAFYEKAHPPAAAEPSASGAKTTTPPAVKEGPIDEVTHARSLEVTPADGTEPFIVREKVTPGTKPVLAMPEAAEAAPKPPEVAPSKYKTLDDILTPDRKGFTDPDIRRRYDEYVASKQKKNQSFVGPEEWAQTFTRGSNLAALNDVLGPGFRRRGDGQYMTDINTIGRPETLTDPQLDLLWARLMNRRERFTTGLRNFIEIGIQNGKVNVGYFHNAKGIVAEILAEPFKQSVLAERQKIHPGAQLFENAMVSRLDSPKPVEFTDGLIGRRTGGGGLEILDRFEVKSGATGGEQAGRQLYEWVEGRMEDGSKLLLNKRPAVPNETLPPGQERIPPNGASVYDVYYYNPTEKQLAARPNLRTVTGVSGGGTLHAVIPESASVLSIDSGAHTVDVKVQDLPATASQINYLTRLILEHVAPVAPAPTPEASAGGTQ